MTAVAIIFAGALIGLGIVTAGTEIAKAIKERSP